LYYSEVPGVFGVFISAPSAPSPFFFLCFPSATQQCRRWPPCRAARGPSLLLLASTRRLQARPPPQRSPAGFPRAHHAVAEPPAATCRRKPPPLAAAAALPAPPPALAAPMRHPQAGCRPSSSPLAFPHALHVAPPLPELCPAPSWLSPVRAFPTLLCWSKTFRSFPSLHFTLSGTCIPH
jgi:hypothetical protein